MKYTLSISFIELLMNLLRSQNEQLLKIISKNEDIDYDTIKHLLPTHYEIKSLIRKK